MLHICILCVGKIKEQFYRDAIAEYSKRLSRYCKFDIVEVADEQTPDNASELMCEAIKQKEASRLLSKIKDNAFVCTLEIKGKKLDSVGFSKFIDDKATRGVSDICFIIGGSLGLHSDVLSRSDMAISFSDMTFPHQLMRVILSEQIYRAFRIINNEPYHK